MPVDVEHREPDRFELPDQDLRRLLGADLAGLPVSVAVEDRQHVGQLLIDDKVQGLGDLALSGLAVADQAIDPLVQPIVFGGHAQPRGHGQPLPQRTRGGIEEADALHRAGVTVQTRIRFPQRENVVHRQRTCLVAFSDHRPQIRQRRVDNGHRMPFGQNQTVGSGVSRMLRQPAHAVIQQDRHEMSQAQCTRGVPTARSGAHVQAGVIELNGFGVDSSFKRHRLPFLYRHTATDRPSAGFGLLSPVVSHGPPAEANRAR